jgi:nucleoside-diphosphate-sugar epimerase/GT2 family glycosyltransferase
LVSVIIVNYNGGPYLLDTVSSALASTVPIELFVVDNGSADGSMRVLERAFAGEQRLRIIENGANLGFARANNIALKYAAGDFLLLLNPDCIVNQDTLQRMVEALRADARAGMAGCLIRNPDGSEQAGCRRTIPTPWTGLVRALHLERFIGDRGLGRVDLMHSPLPAEPIYVEAISGAFMLLRREALEQVGPMDESYFLHCEDLDWCKSFEQVGWKILFVPQVEIVHHKGSCSGSRPIFVLWHKHRGMVLFYRKFLSRNYSAPFNLLVILGVWARFAAMLPIELVRRLRQAPAVQDFPRWPRISTSASQLPPLPGLRGQPVLVTGGTGFIGWRLVKELLRQGAEVQVMTRNPQLVQPPWPGEQVGVVQGDLEDPESLEGVCDGVAILFHLASCTHMLEPAADESAHHRTVTEQGTLALLRVARKAGVECFVFVSSVKAMGEESAQQLDESAPPRPENAYGRAKLHAEQAVLESAARGAMRATVLRLPMVYGPGNKGNLPRMIEAVRRHRFPPPPDVHNRRSMVHVDDAVQALLLVAVNERADGEVYIVTDGRVYSTREIYRLITSHLGRKTPGWSLPLWSIRLGARFGDLLLRLGLPAPLNSGVMRKLFGSAWYSSEKIRKELGFEPHFDLEQALPEMVADASRRPDSPGTTVTQEGALNP